MRVARQRLSVVVPTRDRPTHLSRCLAALRAELGSDDELIVVDSASCPPVQDALRCDRPGASLARNTGWRAARHQLIAFVDDDVEVLPGWADAMVAGLSDAAWVAGAVGVPPGQEARERPVAVTTLTAPTRLTLATRGTLGASANLGVRRSALADVEGFDERLGPGTWTRAAEDLDLMDRLLAAGHEGAFAPTVAAVHDQWRSRRQLVALDHGYGIGLGARLLLLHRRGQRGRLRSVLRDAVWSGTVVTGWRDARAGYRLGTLLALARLAGVLRGAVRGAAVLR
ncbi:MAG: glycosyl transferase family 2 [Frankiales bacterium]|nr:glycosyl transferase family 2 [Frankiales bacterium]